VNYSRFSVLIALLLPSTMAWKLAVGPEDLGELKTEVVQFLSREHFEVTANEQTMDGIPILRATAGECSMLIAKVSPVGADRDVVRRLASQGDQIFFTFQGRSYDDQPTWLTVKSYLWSKALRQLGLIRHVVPVFAVVASPHCNAKKLPWGDM